MAQIGVDIGNYTFDASLKTITFSGVTIDKIEQIKPIVNGETGIVIFNPATDGSFGTLVGNVLTLEYDTTSQADTDPLYICVNIPFVECCKGIVADSSTVIFANPDTSKTYRIADTNRKEIIFNNDTNRNIWLRLGASPAVIGEGVLVRSKSDFVLTSYVGEVRGIADGAAVGKFNHTEITT